MRGVTHAAAIMRAAIDGGGTVATTWSYFFTSGLLKWFIFLFCTSETLQQRYFLERLFEKASLEKQFSAMFMYSISLFLKVRVRRTGCCLRLQEEANKIWSSAAVLSLGCVTFSEKVVGLLTDGIKSCFIVICLWRCDMPIIPPCGMLSLYEHGRSGAPVWVMTLTAAVGNNRFDRDYWKSRNIETFFKHNWTVDFTVVLSGMHFSMKCNINVILMSL